MDPPGQCTCGWAAPLLPFHTTDTVLAKLRRELADEASSCCFIHHDPIGRVDGFAWGYLTGVQGTAQALLPERRQSSARKLLRARLRRLVQEPVSPGAEIADAPAPIFYLSELGVVERARSFSLARALFHRTLQFADDHGASVALLRTSPHANAYALLIGVEMQVVYRYNEPLQERVQGSAKTASNEQSEQDTDERVVLAGDVRQMLHIFNGESDRRLAWRIAHRLRQQRTLPDPLSLEDWGERR